MKKIWRDIKGYEGRYKISNYGEIKSLDRFNLKGEYRKGKILKQSISKLGRVYISLINNNCERKTLTVHRLVAKTFLINVDNLPEVNHKDENPCNNRADNLEWCTAKYNSNYGTRNKRIADKSRIYFRKPVYQYSLDNKFIKRWDSSIQAEREEGYLSAKIGSCCTGNRKTHKGFKWYHEPLAI